MSPSTSFEQMVDVPFYKGTYAQMSLLKPYDNFAWFWDEINRKLYFWNGIVWYGITSWLNPGFNADTVDGHHAGREPNMVYLCPSPALDNITDATGTLGSVTAQLNLLLAALRLVYFIGYYEP